MTEQKWVYFFGEGGSEGDPERKDILGGKGASLAVRRPMRWGFSAPPPATNRCCAPLPSRARAADSPSLPCPTLVSPLFTAYLCGTFEAL